MYSVELTMNDEIFTRFLTYYNVVLLMEHIYKTCYVYCKRKSNLSACRFHDILRR